MKVLEMNVGSSAVSLRGMAVCRYNETTWVVVTAGNNIVVYDSNDSNHNAGLACMTYDTVIDDRFFLYLFDTVASGSNFQHMIIKTVLSARL